MNNTYESHKHGIERHKRVYILYDFIYMSYKTGKTVITQNSGYLRGDGCDWEKKEVRFLGFWQYSLSSRWLLLELVDFV